MQSSDISRISSRRSVILQSAARIEPLERRMLLDAVPVGSEFRVNTYTTLSQHFPAMATDADGDFVITWRSDGQDGSAEGIYAQRYNAMGGAQGSEFRVNTFTTGGQESPAIAMDADGDFVITWQSNQDGSADGIYAQRFNAMGVAQGSEFRVNTFTTSSQNSPAIAMDAEGDFVITWGSFQDGSGSGIYAQRYNATGVAQGSEFRVNTFTTNYQMGPAIAMDAEGDFVITWESELQDGSFLAVYAQRYNAAGVAQGGEFRVNTFTTNNQALIAIAMDADGDFVITWYSPQDGSPLNYSIYAQRYNAAGVAQGSEFRVNTFTTNIQRSPAIAMDADGDFVITWHSSGQDGSSYGVYAQGYNAAGVAQGGEFRVNTFTTNQQTYPAIGMDADGDFVITWSSSGQDGSDRGIYAQRYTNDPAAPAVNASSFLFNNAPHRLSFTFSQDVSGSLGTDDIVLHNLTTMQAIPSSDLSLSYDSGTNTATFSYTGPGSLITSVLPDGNYRATLLAAGITNGQGVPLASNHLFNFFFLNGDANHDANVNLADFNILAANFGLGPRDFSQGDFTYDNQVNLADFNILAGRFGTVLSPQTQRRESAGEDDPIDDLLA